MTQTTDQVDKFQAGVEVRSAVLGAEYVQNSLNNSSPFRLPMQQLSTEWCWGHVWARPGLERKTRSLLNVVMLTALNRPHELQIHVKGAIKNGCTPEEIQEAILQAAIYAGVPAGMDAFKVAEQALVEMDIDFARSGSNA